MQKNSIVMSIEENFPKGQEIPNSYCTEMQSLKSETYSQ